MCTKNEFIVEMTKEEIIEAVFQAWRLAEEDGQNEEFELWFADSGVDLLPF